MNCPNCQQETLDKNLWVLHKPHCKKAVTGYIRFNYLLSPCKCGGELFCEVCAFNLYTQKNLSPINGVLKYDDDVSLFCHPYHPTPAIPVSLSKVLEAHDRYLLEFQDYDLAYNKGNTRAKKAYEKSKSWEWFSRFEEMIVKYIQRYFISDKDDNLHFNLWEKNHNMRQSFIDLAKARRENL